MLLKTIRKKSLPYNYCTRSGVPAVRAAKTTHAQTKACISCRHVLVCA